MFWLVENTLLKNLKNLEKILSEVEKLHYFSHIANQKKNKTQKNEIKFGHICPTLDSKTKLQSLRILLTFGQNLENL